MTTVCFCMCVRLQEERLQVLTQLLKEREEQNQKNNTRRFDKLWYDISAASILNIY